MRYGRAKCKYNDHANGLPDGFLGFGQYFGRPEQPYFFRRQLTPTTKPKIVKGFIQQSPEVKAKFSRTQQFVPFGKK